MARSDNKENTKIRILIIYRMITRGKRITTRNILDTLETRYGISADRKTIYSDIAAIDRIIPIKVSYGRSGGVFGMGCAKGGNGRWQMKSG